MRIKIFLKRSQRNLESLKVLIESQDIEVFTKEEALEGHEIHYILYQSDLSQEAQLNEIEGLAEMYPQTPFFYFGAEGLNPDLAGRYVRAGITEFIPSHWENNQVVKCLHQSSSLQFSNAWGERDSVDMESHHVFPLSKVIGWFIHDVSAFAIYARTPLSHTLITVCEPHTPFLEKDVQKLRYLGIQHCLISRSEFDSWAEMPAIKRVA